MSAIRFGVGLMPQGPASEIVKTAVLAEELGFDGAWLADSHLIWREMYVPLGAIAQATSRLEIGPGVTHPFVRHVSLTASAMATLQELSGGRARLGIGIGDSGPANMGMRRATLAELERSIATIADLMAGKTAGEGDQALKLGFTPAQPVPIYVAGASDRTHAMTGRAAGGAIISGAVDEMARSVGVIRQAEREAGRPAGTVKAVLWSTCSVDPERDAARAAVRAAVARRAMLVLSRRARTGTLDPIDKEPLERLQRQYDTREHRDEVHAPLIEERWLDQFAVAGTPAEVLAKCRKGEEDGADEISMIFAASSGSDVREQMIRFSEAVIRPMKAASRRS